MRSKVFIVMGLYLIFGSNQVWAADCYWENLGGAVSLKVFNGSVPGMVKLSHVPVGKIMGTATISADGITSSSQDRYYVKCPLPDFRYTGFLEARTLAEGYSDVYKTNLTGIGVKFKPNSSYGYLPVDRVFVSGSFRAVPLYKFEVEFVRISQKVESGNLDLNVTVVSAVNAKRFFEVRFAGTTNVEAPDYFSGCTGVEKLNVPIGRILLSDLGEALWKPFNLDVLCSGAAAGTKIPVKVYFEGDSDGPGRLNLEPGGAQGVEISLRNDRGVKLPFSKDSALDMTWTRSEPKGEIYRLPIVAEYVKKAAQKVEPGKANATVNYILEYN